MKNTVRKVVKRLSGKPVQTRKRIRRTLLERPIDGLVAELEKTFESSGIDFFRGGSIIGGKRRLSFFAEDAPRVLQIVEDLLKARADIIAFNRANHILNGTNIVERFGVNAPLFFLGTVVERRDISNGNIGPAEALFVAYLEIGFWREAANLGPDTYAPTLPHAALGPSDPTAIPKDLAVERNMRTGDFTSEPEFPIDAIFTWVDSSDPAWVRDRARYDEATASEHANGINRFRNLDELRYSLRSLEMYAPFIRKVFLVTSGHAPAWLNLDSDRIELVRHDQIFRDKRNLPTFNSSAIETALHRIPGLSEHHLYLNDDFFFARPARASQYFAANGIAFVHPSEQKVNHQYAPSFLPEWLSSDRNASIAFEKRLGFTPMSVMKHVPYCGTVSTVKEMEREWPELFAAGEKNRFRSMDDIRPYAFMFPHYASHFGRAVPGTVSHRYVSLRTPDLPRILSQMAFSADHDTFVLNDEGDHPVLGREAQVELVRSFLETCFPIKSEFEK